MTATETSFFEWLEQPRQIVLFSLFFIIFCFCVTKLSKRRKRKHQDFRVRDPRKGHHWVHSDFIIKPTFCNVCETTVVRGAFCDTCWVCLHDECEDDGNKRLACKIMSLSSERTTMKHHWVKGNLPLCSKCDICKNPCGVEPKLCDYRCVWCQLTVHEGECFGKHLDNCTFGDHQKMVLPPFCVSLKTVGWKGYFFSSSLSLLVCVFCTYHSLFLYKIFSAYFRFMQYGTFIQTGKVPPN